MKGKKKVQFQYQCTPNLWPVLCAYSGHDKFSQPEEICYNWIRYFPLWPHTNWFWWTIEIFLLFNRFAANAFQKNIAVINSLLICWLESVITVVVQKLLTSGENLLLWRIAYYSHFFTKPTCLNFSWYFH